MRIHVVAAIGVILLLTTLPFGQATDGQCDSLRSVCPQGGFVPDQQTAVLIAEAVLTPIYGHEHIESERPFTARLEGNRLDCARHTPEGQECESDRHGWNGDGRDRQSRRSGNRRVSPEVKQHRF